MNDTVTVILKDWVSLILLGLGISFSPHMYIGGLFLAFAGAAISRALEREKAHAYGDTIPRESVYRFWLVVITAFFVSTLTAIVVNVYFPSWSVQVVMGASGFASRKVVILCISIIESLSKKGDTIANRVVNKVFPEERVEDDK